MLHWRRRALLPAFQAALARQTSSTSKTPEQSDAAIHQLVSKAITSEGQVIDVFSANTTREGACAKLGVMGKRIRNNHGYPPDLQEEAAKTVLAQAELLCAHWV